MKYSTLICTAVIAAFAVSFSAAPAAAKGGPKSPKVHAPKAKPANAAKAHSAAPKPKAQAPKVNAAGASKAKASTAPKGSGKVAATKSDKPAASGKKTADNKESKASASDAILTPVTLSKAQQQLLKNDNLRMKMQERLGFRDVIGAASDFRNLGQFVAAVNTSYHNPAIDFFALKKLMTTEPRMSLGQAKKQLLATASTATAPTRTVTAQR